MESIIKIEGLSKSFVVNRSHLTTFKVLKGRFQSGISNPEAFYALRNINLDILRGEKIGLIGDNGSGKTTLLKVIAGLYAPNRGSAWTGGKIVLLSGFGLGMNDELTVEENIFLYGIIYRMKRNKIKEKFHEIIAFSDLNDFVKTRVKMLSSGMRQKLAFAITTQINTDILLLDEALSVGDIKFKEKCNTIFEGYKNSDMTIVVATHDLEFVKSFCSKALWLHKGNQMAYGDAENITIQYQNARL